ncbi:hypothetical protein H8356DRAFT_1359110 [Neocallimastix lanati (nom. inval.)]|nr:hypothetical protein H8356DRAFT_1359110 [Neocallimastix sp. JGI-2020a]
MSFDGNRTFYYFLLRVIITLLFRFGPYINPIPSLKWGSFVCDCFRNGTINSQNISLNVDGKL